MDYRMMTRRWRRWLRDRLRPSPVVEARARTAIPKAPLGRGGRLADARDLSRSEFGAALADRFADRDRWLSPRKRWELLWIADKYAEIHGARAVAAMLGLGVGNEPLIYHFAHFAQEVLATDLYDEDGVWREARYTADRVRAASPFPYPAERLTVENMDMRAIHRPTASVDVVWSCSSVEHVSTLSELLQVFREIHRVLKPGGIALITTEFSLGEPYFLPGVLSLWRDSALFSAPLRGLEFLGPVDLTHHVEHPGNRPTRRGDVHRQTLLEDGAGRPSGVAVQTGYTQLIPVAMAFIKTGEHFDWPAHLGAPAWYVEASSGIEKMGRRRPAEAAAHFEQALTKADRPGARLHCLRHLVEAHVHATQVAELHAVLDACAEAFHELPDDDDAWDLIAYVAAGQGRLALARRAWERAAHSPGALPSSRLRIRHNQLHAELEAHGNCQEARHLSALADAAWCESVGMHGAGDYMVLHYEGLLRELRAKFQLESLISSTPDAAAASPAAASSTAPPIAAPPMAAPPSAVALPAPITIRNPAFDLTRPPLRPIVSIGEGRVLTKTVYGHKMCVDATSQVGACFALDGYWEEWVVRGLSNYLQPGMRAIDIGANMGFYTILLAELVGPTGHVTAFEPWPPYHALLKRNLEMNGFEGRTTVEALGVHAAASMKSLAFDPTYGTGTVRNTPLGPESNLANGDIATLDVRCVSLDEYLAANPQSIDFIKIDSDGGEPFIFRGMHGLLSSDAPLTILCEFSPVLYAKIGEDPSALLHQLQGYGLSIAAILPTGVEIHDTFDSILNAEWSELLLQRRPRST